MYDFYQKKMNSHIQQHQHQIVFLQKGKQQGAIIKNGLEMLHLQAEKAWQIWNEG